ncbi:hypothetical protein NEMIN01_1051 [Nematocida minor]|uniref:uncharacterized protein n=1 Tax=Nematocida minor TaxID=1912983 RepID=UPI0022202884|nr:uncharacterized protein NEMIN01_1051 [Nematocida minor]KAI5190427.1 hypothetical protein NEMIN01_1051 [Nematocida minor]
MRRGLRRRFSFSASVKEFSAIIWSEIFTSGQGHELNKYYTVTAETIRVDIKETERPHSPLIETMFVFMLCLLYTILLKCAIFSVRPTLFDIPGCNIFINSMIFFISLVLVVLEFRKIYRPELA